jgi:hypothetical protein
MSFWTMLRTGCGLAAIAPTGLFGCGAEPIDEDIQHQASAVATAAPAYGVMYADGWLGSSNLYLAGSNGLTYVRANFLFDATRAYDEPLTDYDWVVENALAGGATVLPVLMKTEGGPAAALNLHSADERARWERFAWQLATRYGPTGTFWSEHEGTTPRPILAWEIWNEPNLDVFGDVKPKAFRTTLRLARRGLRAADPGARIVLGGLSFAGEAMQYLEEVAGTKSARCLFDAVAIHPYAATPDKALALVERTVEKLRDLGLHGRGVDRDVGVWITEIGWAIANADWPLCAELAGGTCKKKAAFTVADEETQASYMAAFARGLDEKRSAWRIGPTIWFAYSDLPPSPQDPGQKWWRHCGLFGLDAAGQPTVVRPSFWRTAEIAAARPTVTLPPVRCP